MPTPSPSLCTPTCPARMPSPFAIGGTVPQPVPSAMLCKPCPLVYAPTPHAHPPLVPSTQTTPWPPPLVYTPHPACMPSPFAHMSGVQEDRGDVHKGHVSEQGGAQPRQRSCT